MLNLLGTSGWPRHVFDVLGLQLPLAGFHAGAAGGSESPVAAAGTSVGSSLGAAQRSGPGSGSAQLWATRAVDSLPPQSAWESSASQEPVPPPGTPPAATIIRSASRSPDSVRQMPSSSASAVDVRSSSSSGRGPAWGSGGAISPLDAEDREQADESGENLDALMDMVLGMAPAGGAGGGGREAGGAFGRRDGGRPGGRSGMNGDAARGPQPTLIGALQEERHEALPPRPPKQLAPLETSALGHSRTKSAEMQEQRTVSPKTGGRQAPGSDELGVLARLVVQAYTAVNIAPACGQIPESLGPAHVFRIFSGQMNQGFQAPELRWLQENPELFRMTLRAFRYALKVTIDCVVTGEDATSLEFAELEAALRELDTGWHLGEEASGSWKAAMQQRVPNLMALRKNGASEVQVLRLCLKEDGVRVGELRPEVVQSIWASSSLELRYFTNDDDERYSIQAHPTLLRNMIVQTSEYPIFVSPPLTVWL